MLLLAMRELAKALFPLSTLAIPHPLHCYGMTEYFSLQREYNRETPQGPLLFCLSISDLCSQLRSEFNVWYQNDGFVGGILEDIRHGLELVYTGCGVGIGPAPSEVCSDQHQPCNSQSHSVSYPRCPGIGPSKCHLAGLPIGDVASITSVINDKIRHHTTIGERLQHHATRDILLHFRSIVSDITNIILEETAWTQASLLVRSGRLGIRSSVQLARFAFLALAAVNSDLTHHILPLRFQLTELPYIAEATNVWSMGLDLHPPLSGTAFHRQKAWDALKVSAMANALLKQALDAFSCSCLLAASTKESGAWLNALPVSSLGLRMDNNTARFAVGLRLGSPLCRPNTCQLWCAG